MMIYNIHMVMFGIVMIYCIRMITFRCFGDKNASCDKVCDSSVKKLK